MFFAGAALGAFIPLLRKDNQKRAAGLLAALLIATSLILIGHTIGSSRAKSRLQATIIALSNPTPHTLQVSIAGDWEFSHFSSGEKPRYYYKRISFNTNKLYSGLVATTDEDDIEWNETDEVAFTSGEYTFTTDGSNTLLLKPIGKEDSSFYPTQIKIISHSSQDKLQIRFSQGDYEAVYQKRWYALQNSVGNCLHTL